MPALRSTAVPEPMLTRRGERVRVASAWRSSSVRPASRFGAEGEGPSIYLEDPEGNMIELKGPTSEP